jgi:hypothetical protein
MNRVFNAFVRQTNARLSDVHAQHSLRTDRKSATAIALGIERFNLSYQRGPRRHLIDLAQKLVASRNPLRGGVFKIRKTRLHRQGPIKSQYPYFLRTPTEKSYPSANKSTRP